MPDDAAGPLPPFKSVSYAGTAPGARLIVLGAVHGNETCGTRAIERVIGEIDAGSLRLGAGRLTLVPVANPLAYAARRRAGDRNLNRKLAPSEAPRDFEDHVANWLCPLLAEHEVLLDLHSFSSPGVPFVFIGPPDNAGPIEPFAQAAREEAIAARLGVGRVVDGWLSTYAAGVARRRELAASRATARLDLDPRYGIGTTEYMRSLGGCAVTLECGRHSDPQAPEIAYRAIVNVLAHLGATDAPDPAPVARIEALRLHEVVDRLDGADALAKDWKSFDPVAAGERIGTRHDGAPVVAPVRRLCRLSESGGGGRGGVVLPGRGERPVLRLSDPDRVEHRPQRGGDVLRGDEIGQPTELRQVEIVLEMEQIARNGICHDPGKERAMKLVTWNIQWCRGVDGRVDPARIVADARAFADFDVLCLQEVAANFPALEGSRGEDQFALLAGLLPGYTALAGVAVDVAAPGGARRRFGNMILSRLPVRQAMRMQLPWPVDQAATSMPRLLLEALVEAPFGPLRVMTTHLEYYSALQRAAQVEALRSRHAEACAHARSAGKRDDSEGPFRSQPQTVSAILTGDFNFRPGDPLHARLAARFDDGDVPALADAWHALHPDLAPPPTIGVHDRAQWPEPFACDFIHASSDLRDRLRSVAVDATSRASDHQPMMIELA